MRRLLSVAAGFIAVLILAPCGLAVASEPPDSEVNPQSGAIEIVDSSSQQSNYDIRYVINPGGGDPPAVSFLTTNAADDNRPRVEIESDGDTWVVWWRSGSTDQVLFRRKDYSSGTWQQERLVSDENESSRNPVIIDDGTSMWVAFEFDDGSGLGIAVGIIDEDPDPFPSPSTVATTDHEDVDTRIYAESGKLWVTWIDSSSDVGWAEYDYTAESWSNASYESYAQDDVQSARGRIRSSVLGQ